MPPRVLIAGGGVGGLALAVGLRARGVTDVRVLERDASLESAAARSTGLALWPNGCAALRALAPALRLDEVAAAGEPLTASFFAPGGCGPGAPPPIRQAHAPGAVSLRWRALTKALAAALPADTLLCGAPLQSLTQLPSGGVRATFGAPGGGDSFSLEADVFVGADGIRSVVRCRTRCRCQDQPRRGS